MKENKKNVITIIVAVTLLLVFVIGLTYALFSFTGKGERINQISTTSVTMSYSEAQNGITLTNAMPISDAAGIVLSDANQTFEFTVSVVTGSGVPVAWEVAAEKLTGSNLDNDKVRIYLEKKAESDLNYTAVSSPGNFVPEINQSVIGTRSGEMILDQDSATSSVTYNYKLRMWVSDTYILDENERSFSIKINVYGKDNYQSASSISLNKNSTTITVGNSETLTTTVTPNDAYNGDVTWTSSDTSVATVNSSGVVTGVSVGSATVTARTKNGKSATCNITIDSIPTSGLIHNFELNGNTTDSIGSETVYVSGTPQYEQEESRKSLKLNGSTAVYWNESSNYSYLSTFSFSVWIKQKVSATSYIIGWGGNDRGYYSAAIDSTPYNGAQLNFGVCESYNSSSCLQIHKNVNLNEWYHFVVISANGTIKYYVNGTLIGSGNIPIVSSNYGTTMIGGLPASGAVNVYGNNHLVNRFRYYNRELTEEEITRLYEE